MKISLLSHDVSTNALGRAHLLARLLAPVYEVEITGPASTGQLWEPLRGDEQVPIRVVPSAPLRELATHADGDILYAIKERPTSLGVALAARRQRPRPLLVDADDWEMGFLYDDARAMVRSRFRHGTRWVARTLVDVRSPNNAYRTLLTERRVREADAVTVSSQWLADRFGGTVVVHARDGRALDPATVDRDAVRRELDVPPDMTLLLFMGSPRRHKGLASIVAALDRLGRDDITLLCVGGDPGLAPHPHVRTLGVQPLGSVTRFLTAADVIVLPQQEGPASRGQMPAKVYDALAMATPVVVSDVSDLADTVRGCGLVVPPGDVPALAEAIAELADDPGLRHRLGAAGRERFLREFSDDAVRPRLLELVTRVVTAGGERTGAGLSTPR